MGSKIITAALIMLLLMSLASSAVLAGDTIRYKGSLGVRAYGYEDIEDNHLWLFQNLRVSAWQNEGPLSFHFSGGYTGDNADDFSASGRGRFLKGYFQYGKTGENTVIRGGRMFLYRGVGIGVLDGIDASSMIRSNLKFSVYAGMMGPFTRDFEFEKPEDGLSIGGELKWKPAALAYVGHSTFALSYTKQARNGEDFRHRLGLTSSHRISRELRWMNNVQLRMNGNLFRKFTSRLRYFGDKISGMVEAGVIVADAADYSWFTEFETGNYSRVRFAGDYWFAANKWAGGIEGGFIASGETGFRGGPVLTSPWGQFGYRVSSGEHSLSSGPWFSLKYNVNPELEIYGYGAMIDYEWDAFDVEQEDLTMLYAGCKYNPTFMECISLSAQYQQYSTPQYNQDRRMMAGINWKFDSGRKTK